MPINFENVQISGGLVFAPEIVTPTGDPYWANVSLLLNNGTGNNRTNNTFVDNSTGPAGTVVTRVGTPTQGSFSPFPLAPNTSYTTSVNGGSGYFDGDGDYLSVADRENLRMGTGDFTIECWAYLTGGSGSRTLIAKGASGTSGWGIYVNSSNVFVVGHSATDLVSSKTASLNTWYHVAFVRSGTTARIYIDGISSGTTTISTNFNQTEALVIGTGRNTALEWVGYMSGVRIVKGTAVYTSNFTPPTAPPTAISGTSLLLNFTYGGIYDATTRNLFSTLGDAKVSNTQAKFGTTSIAFDGTGDYLRTPDSNTAYSLGTADFTVECWIYLNNLTGSKFIIDARPEGTLGVYPAWIINTSSLTWSVNGVSAISGTLSATSWTHVAVARSSGITKMFINGTQVGSDYSDSNNYLSSGRFNIGGSSFNPGLNSLNGFLEEMRITKGVARYTSNFSVPTAPFLTY